MSFKTVSEGQHVRIVIETSFEESFEDLLELAAKVYEGLSDDDIDSIEKIAHGRRDFSGDRKGA
ncbi:MAG: hypothetical protein J4F29_21365 [Candidatus Latescibacteria bacterium]|nr:hypothetical protein [Candidatus Latescibacterota bacterium]